MNRLVRVVAGVGIVVGGVLWWRRHPREGSDWVNRVANPWLVRRGVTGFSHGEIGLLEHVGRKTGLVRVTPVHPVTTIDGFRIIVPLGTASHWARNVLAAGHCRLQVADEVHELDEPQLIRPSLVTDRPGVAGRLMDWLGFRYLALRRFATRPGTLESARADTTPAPTEAVETIGVTPEAVPA